MNRKLLFCPRCGQVYNLVPDTTYRCNGCYEHDVSAKYNKLHHSRVLTKKELDDLWANSPGLVSV